LFLLLFFSIENFPCQNIQLSILNFDENEGYIIKAMVELIGGIHDMKEVTSKTNIIISQK